MWQLYDLYKCSLSSLSYHKIISICYVFWIKFVFVQTLIKQILPNNYTAAQYDPTVWNNIWILHCNPCVFLVQPSGGNIHPGFSGEVVGHQRLPGWSPGYNYILYPHLLHVLPGCFTIYKLPSRTWCSLSVAEAYKYQQWINGSSILFFESVWKVGSCY